MFKIPHVHESLEELLQQIAPDIIFTQDTCEVCQIDAKCTAAAVAKLARRPQIIPLTPASLEDVYATAVTIARAVGREENAYCYLAGRQQRTDRLLDILRQDVPPLLREKTFRAATGERVDSTFLKKTK